MINAYYHPQLADGRWAAMPLALQMANIGSEVHRTYNFLRKGNPERARICFERGLELIDLTIDAKPRRTAMRELCRVMEFFCEIYLSKNFRELESLDKYFYSFALAANKLKADTAGRSSCL